MSKLKLGCIYFFIIRVFVFSGYMPGVRLLDHMLTLALVFSRVAVPIHIKREIDSQT